MFAAPTSNISPPENVWSGAGRPGIVSQYAGEPGWRVDRLLNVTNSYAELRVELGDYVRDATGVIGVAVRTQDVARYQAA